MRGGYPICCGTPAGLEAECSLIAKTPSCFRTMGWPTWPYGQRTPQSAAIPRIANFGAEHLAVGSGENATPGFRHSPRASAMRIVAPDALFLLRPLVWPLWHAIGPMARAREHRSSKPYLSPPSLVDRPKGRTSYDEGPRRGRGRAHRARRERDCRIYPTG
jgi:hypothetical protein